MTVEEKLNKSDFATVKNFLNMVLKGKRQATEEKKGYAGGRLKTVKRERIRCRH